ncbi:MAG: HlyD family efflux transporter periplasmic adaptor subunit, partial [Polymorphobacter sp.]
MPFSAAKSRATAALLLGTLPLLLPALLPSCAPVAATPAVAPDYAVTASGRLDTRFESRFLAAERDGRIAQVLVRPGDRVAAGDALLRIGCDDLAAEARAAAARADASAAQARLVAAGPRREVTAEAAARAAEMRTRRA